MLITPLAMIVCICVCMHACVYTCICAYMYVCVCVCCAGMCVYHVCMWVYNKVPGCFKHKLWQSGVRWDNNLREREGGGRERERGWRRKGEKNNSQVSPFLHPYLSVQISGHPLSWPLASLFSCIFLSRTQWDFLPFLPLTPFPLPC